MATRSRIGLQLANDSVLSVYCHWDGYPEFNGVKLVEHFNSFQKAAELIDGGDMSGIWTNLGYDREVLAETGPLYYSGRGEDRAPILHDTLEEYLSDGEEYHYLFTNDEWVCYNMNQFDDSKLPEVVAIPSPVAA
jgi:hypothetical protein